MLHRDITLYDKTCFECSKLITEQYSTSFSSGIKAFHKRFRNPIYAIYGFVRYADEIVDTFHDHDKAQLINDFRLDTFKAIDQKISLNPVLHSFQLVVNSYKINPELIRSFLHSMEMDLDKKAYTVDEYKAYIHGSSEVIGLMCLHVFCEGDEKLYQSLSSMACSLGAAFQKVNFLRDVKADYDERGRVYFPGVSFLNFSETAKKAIEDDIEIDFNNALIGIQSLPAGTNVGVFLAYNYYLQLFEKIKGTPATELVKKRIRIDDSTKKTIYASTWIKQKLKLI